MSDRRTIHNLRDPAHVLLPFKFDAVIKIHWQVSGMYQLSGAIF